MKILRCDLNKNARSKSGNEHYYRQRQNYLYQCCHAGTLGDGVAIVYNNIAEKQDKV